MGTQAKFDFLAHELGVPRDHIFNSRESSFAAAISAATGGRGVDAVLNSLSGELLACVLGVRWHPEEVVCWRLASVTFSAARGWPCHVFEEKRASFGIDLSRLSLSMPDAISRQTVDLLEQSHFRPLWPTTVFDAEKVEDALRLMQQGVRMGRIIVRMPMMMAASCPVHPQNQRLASGLMRIIFLQGAWEVWGDLSSSRWRRTALGTSPSSLGPREPGTRIERWSLRCKGLVVPSMVLGPISLIPAPSKTPLVQFKSPLLAFCKWQWSCAMLASRTWTMMETISKVVPKSRVEVARVEDLRR